MGEDMSPPKVLRSQPGPDPDLSVHGDGPLKPWTYRRLLVDATSMAIFWTVAYTPIFLYTSRSLEAALLGLASAAVLEVLLGGVYGRFSDWFRIKLRAV